MDEIEYLGATSTMQSYNLFTYCEGNPVNMVDESGTWPKLLDKLVGAAVALASSVIAAATAIVSTAIETVVTTTAAVVATAVTTAQTVIDAVVVPTMVLASSAAGLYYTFKFLSKIEVRFKIEGKYPDERDSILGSALEVSRERYEVIRMQYDLMPYS